MVSLRCQDCGSVVEGQKSRIDSKTCECGGSFAIKDSEDDSYEPTPCPKCGEDTGGEETYGCDECEEVDICEDCSVMLENVSVCKSCVDDVYPREQKVVEKEIVKYVEVPKETIKVMSFSEPIL